MLRNILFLFLISFFLSNSSGYSQTKKNYTLAIINLDAKGIPNTEVEVLSDRLRTNISQLLDTPAYLQKGKEIYTVVEREQMDKILDQFNMQNTGCVSDSCAVVYGKMLQADRIVIGTAGKIGELYTLTARIIDVESGKSVATAARDTRGSIEDFYGKVIPLIVNDLFFGRKKSNMKWYLITAAVAAAASAAALSGGSDSGGSGSVPLPLPPDMP